MVSTVLWDCKIKVNHLNSEDITLRVKYFLSYLHVPSTVK